MAGGKEEYNAFFYSLVSTDTQVNHFIVEVAIKTEIHQTKSEPKYNSVLVRTRFQNTEKILLSRTRDLNS